jgi:hypothetical protein
MGLLEKLLLVAPQASRSYVEFLAELYWLEAEVLLTCNTSVIRTDRNDTPRYRLEKQG